MDRTRSAARACGYSRAPPALTLLAPLDRIPDQFRDVRAAEALYFVDAGGTRHVDLGEVVADHVDAGEDQAAALQFRTDRVADVLLARRQARRLGAAADMHVGARLARRRNAVDRTGELTVDQDDALVALAHFGEIALHDHWLA